MKTAPLGLSYWGDLRPEGQFTGEVNPRLVIVKVSDSHAEIVSGSLTRQGNSGKLEVKLDRAVPQVLSWAASDRAGSQPIGLSAGFKQGSHCHRNSFQLR